MIHELRIYECVPGRLPALHKRFETVTLGFWEKYGIRQIGFWTTMIGDSNLTLTYLIEWKDLAEREQKVDGDSPRRVARRKLKGWLPLSDAVTKWTAARAKTEKDGPIVVKISNSILQPTAYSKLQ